jgi:hypothetical protein
MLAISRNCPECKVQMDAEIQNIPKGVRIPLFGSISIESYIPNVIKRYTYYTAYVCPNCAKLEVFLGPLNNTLSTTRLSDVKVPSQGPANKDKL